MAKPQRASAQADEKQGGEQVLYVKESERAPERVLASFPLDADSSLIDAAKLREINRANAAGLDEKSLQFRVGREAI